jgi:hypothetical protein
MAKAKEGKKEFPHDPRNCSHQFEMEPDEPSFYPSDNGVKKIPLVVCQGCGTVRPKC